MAESQLQIRSAISPSKIPSLLKPSQLAYQPPVVAKDQGSLQTSSSSALSLPSQFPWQKPSGVKQPLEVPGSPQAMSISPDGRSMACQAFKSRDATSSLHFAGSGCSGSLPPWPKRKRSTASGLLHVHSQNPPAPQAVSSLSMGQHCHVSTPVVKTQRPDTPATLAISGGSGSGKDSMYFKGIKTLQSVPCWLQVCGEFAYKGSKINAMQVHCGQLISTVSWQIT